MGFLDFFKSKSDGQPERELTLEDVLQKAASEPAFQPEFYKRLLTDELIVLTDRSHLENGSRTLKENTEVNLVSFSDGKIPIFTSTDRIFDKQVVKSEVQYMGMKGESLFNLAKGATFLLNPYSDYGKELLPGEVEKILNGTILSENAETITVQKETNIQIGQPSKYPDNIINSLVKLYAERSSVRAAYLGWIYNPESGEPPHYIFAIDTDEDMQSISEETGFTAQQYLDKDEIVDIIKLGRGGISDYFRHETSPFFTR